MKYIESPSNDAFFNMALEEYVFEQLPKDEEYFMLWQNKNAVVVGKFQNTIEEIDAEFVRQKGISVVRRLSGGGAMYQDMGNLNFTFVVDQAAAAPLDFAMFIQPVVHALAQIGVTAEANSRNDIVIDGKKFSGNSQYNRHGRTMHHGTLLFDSDLSVVGRALRVKAEKIQSKGVQSVRSRVTNIASYLPEPITLPQFKQILLTHMFSGNKALAPCALTEKDLAQVQQLADKKYATWEWVYGRSPACDLRREKRYPFGGVSVFLQTNRGRIGTAEFRGDFFGNGDIVELSAALAGVPLREEDILRALEAVDVDRYISGMDAPALARLLLG